eukprot:856920-Pelagomonas_calceolata.AAC.5
MKGRVINRLQRAPGHITTQVDTGIRQGNYAGAALFLLEKHLSCCTLVPVLAVLQAAADPGCA